jgi:hypothetical protein
VAKKFGLAKLRDAAKMRGVIKNDNGTKHGRLLTPKPSVDDGLLLLLDTWLQCVPHTMFGSYIWS